MISYTCKMCIVSVSMDHTHTWRGPAPAEIALNLCYNFASLYVVFPFLMNDSKQFRMQPIKWRTNEWKGKRLMWRYGWIYKSIKNLIYTYMVDEIITIIIMNREKEKIVIEVVNLVMHFLCSVVIFFLPISCKELTQCESEFPVSYGFVFFFFVNQNCDCRFFTNRKYLCYITCIYANAAGDVRMDGKWK